MSFTIYSLNLKTNSEFLIGDIHCYSVGNTSTGPGEITKQIIRGGKIWFLYSNGTVEECYDSEEEEITEARRLFNIKDRPILGRNQFQGRGSTFSVVEIPFNSPVKCRGFSLQERNQGTEFESEESDFISVSENQDEHDSGNWELSSCDDDDDDDDDDYSKQHQYDSDDLY
ncbi:Hypothetical predicted protein [Mytilus galloprovincialis]|uniref:Uncharacterized protein n=1 Tax=Mytilus galloprovincialis TaxID=29158 RepID=A0A8B6DCZ2_MYTGA|nr:Hypothetical predicted protein [Mytilus galloprovincialis]